MAPGMLGSKCSVALLLMMAFACGSARAFWFVPDGETRPPSNNSANHLKEGETLEIECTLTNETWQRTCNASDMSIRLFKHPQDTEYHIVGNQTPTGEYTITMVLERATTNESGAYYCFCHDRALFPLKVVFTIQA